MTAEGQQYRDRELRQRNRSTNNVVRNGDGLARHCLKKTQTFSKHLRMPRVTVSIF